VRFHYQLSFHRVGASDLDWPILLDGWFLAGQTVRQGMGHFDLMTGPVRGEGLDPNLGLLDHMAVDYDTGVDPITIKMDIYSLADPAKTDGPTHFMYDYAAAQDGRHEMTFELVANVVPGPDALIETVDVTSLWLDSGEGTGALLVVSGDGAGST